MGEMYWEKADAWDLQDFFFLTKKTHLLILFPMSF